MSRLEGAVARSPVAAGGRLSHRGHVSVIAYHGVRDPRAFRAQLTAIARFHSFISPNDLRAWLDGGSLPPNPVLLTFDDGERSVLDHAAPVLEEMSIDSLLFVVAGLVDSDTPFWWDEVADLAPNGLAEVRRLKTVPNAARLAAIAAMRERSEEAGVHAMKAPQLTSAELRQLADVGFEVGNHSYDHPCLDRCDVAEAGGQVERAHLALTKQGFHPTAFAYPNGNLDTRVETTLGSLGYELGFLFDHRHTQRGRRLRLSRLRLDADASADRALAILSGVHGMVMRARRRG